MGLWQRLACWRQHPADRLAQDSFLEDIARQWQPKTAAERRLERKARAWHLVARLFDGRETLAPVALSLIPAALATGVLAVAGQPTRADYGQNAPALGYLLLTVGAVGMACEAIASPHAVRPMRWSLFAVPIAIGSVLGAVGLGKELLADQLIVAGFVALAGGMLLLTALPLVPDLVAQAKWLRAGMVISGVGLLLTVASDLYWTALFRADGDNVSALGSALASVGAWLFGTALIRARPVIAPVAA